MRRSQLSAAALAATAALGLSAAPALAQGAGSRPDTHTHHTRHHHAAATASAKLYLYDAFFVSGQTVDVPGRTLHITGRVSRYVPRQKVTLRLRLGTSVKTMRLRVRPSKSGREGLFVARYAAPAAGVLHIGVVHHRSPALGYFEADRGVEIAATQTSDKLFTELVQQRLAARHLYMPQSGVWDLQTELAITAYHRLLGHGTSSTLDPATLTALLDGQGAFPVRFPHQGRHVEGSLSLQLAALIDGSKVVSIYPISSGKPSTPTILGSYQIYRRVPGYLPDGMYYSDFFIRGYALHGYDPAPDYPASHGCMRLPISDAISAFDWLQIGDWVDVYGTPSGSV